MCVYLAEGKVTKVFICFLYYRPMSINDLVESMVINLSLTGGNGLYHALSKEKLWPERRIVIYDNDTGNTNLVFIYLFI